MYAIPSYYARRPEIHDDRHVPAGLDDIGVPQGGAQGMILTSGGRFAGYGFYLLKGKPVFLWNLVEEEREKFVSLVEKSNDVITMTDPGGKITYVNESGMKLLGYSSTKNTHPGHLLDS